MAHQKPKEPLTCPECKGLGWTADYSQLTDHTGIERCILVGWTACPRGCRTLPSMEVLALGSRLQQLFR